MSGCTEMFGGGAYDGALARARFADENQRIVNSRFDGGSGAVTLDLDLDIPNTRFFILGQMCLNASAVGSQAFNVALIARRCLEPHATTCHRLAKLRGIR